MIQKILEKEALKNESNLNEAASITEVKLLLSNNEMEDLRLLENAFPNSTNVNVINENGERERIKKLRDMHKGDIYTSLEIKELCKKYRLKFLPANLYKGSIPVTLLHELKSKFNNENKMSHLQDGTKTIYERNLFIIAPSEMFTVESYYNKKKASIKEAKRLRRLDPACFVKIEDDKYLFIKEWGNSFSIMRRCLGAITATQRSMSITFFIAWVAYVILGFLLTSFLSNFFTITETKGNSEIHGLLFFELTFLSLLWFFITSLSWVASPDYGFFMSEFKSNSFWEVDEKYSSDKNWNEK